MLRVRQFNCRESVRAQVQLGHERQDAERGYGRAEAAGEALGAGLADGEGAGGVHG